jgi:hypothetical protein
VAEEFNTLVGAERPWRNEKSLRTKWRKLLASKPTGAGGLSDRQKYWREVDARCKDKAKAAFMIDGPAAGPCAPKTAEEVMNVLSPGDLDDLDGEEHREVDQLGMEDGTTAVVVPFVAQNLAAGLPGQPITPLSASCSTSEASTGTPTPPTRRRKRKRSPQEALTNAKTDMATMFTSMILLHQLRWQQEVAERRALEEERREDRAEERRRFELMMTALLKK